MNERLRIAVADDEAFIRRYFQEVLPDLGHEVVVVASNGRQLVEGCLGCERAPDLVLSDIRMPEMDGIEAAAAIAQRVVIPVILISAFHDEDLIGRAAASEVMAYLIKPIGRPDLEAAIRIAYGRFRQLRSLQEEASRLRQSLEERKVIERAKGLLMKLTGLGEEEAFRRMQQMACDKNEKLLAIAHRILAAGPAVELIAE